MSKMSNLEKLIRAELNKSKTPKELRNKTSLLMDIGQKLNSEFYKKFTYCKVCGRYYKTELQKEETIIETDHRVCVYRDCGYGDDDEYADVTYEKTFAVCPLCKKRNRELRRFPIH